MININITLTYLELYLILINSLAFIIYGYDKLRAIRTNKNLSRVSELRLLMIAVVGGTVGTTMAIKIFRYKRKRNGNLLERTL